VTLEAVEMMKNITNVILSFLLAFNALAGELPSDEEMMRKGREMINGLDNKQNLYILSMPLDIVMKNKGKEILNGLDKKVEIEMESPSRGAKPIEQPEYLSPLAKELMNETLEAKLNQPGSDLKKGETDLLVFVSFSLPEKLLIEYSKQAKEAGATLILRGLVEHSITKTQQKAAIYNPVLASWEINPGIFRKFNIDKVPSIVLADASHEEIDSSGCAFPADYIKIDGDLSIKQALYNMGWQGKGRFAQLAKQKLKQIEEQ
jgi:type-F conjugative transfer system pilin assembly protein TrbC